MTLAVETAEALPREVVAVGVPVWEGEDGPAVGGDLLPGEAGAGASDDLRRALSTLGGRPDSAWLRRQGFSARPGQALVLRAAGGPPSIVLLGMGAAPTADIDRWRRAAAALVRQAGEEGIAALVLTAAAAGDGGGPRAESARASAVAEGAVLAAYRFDVFRSSPRPGTVDRLVVVGGGPEAAAGARRGARAAEAVVLARDLINTPPSDLTPCTLSDRAAEALRGQDAVTVEVWDEDRIAAERFGGLLGVSRGSSQPPRFVRACYEPPGGGEGTPHVVLVGKGITFDSGGLSLKTAEGMTTMKTDMSGAAIVLATLSACADLGVGVRVTALAPIAENMPGGGAIKPGDVLRARNGSTIEVLNTDAEGRLVLADALSLAAELRPDAIVDVATLTGAATVALGTGVGALFGNDDALVERVRRAGARAGERLWPLPMPEDYGEHIDSDVADMKNVGRPGQAGSIAAALLLGRFVDGRPWAHLDIAGTGRSTESTGYLSKGGTGFGVRTLLALLDEYGADAGAGAGASEGRSEAQSADS